MITPNQSSLKTTPPAKVISEESFYLPFVSRAMWTLSTGNPFHGHEVSGESLSLNLHSLT